MDPVSILTLVNGSIGIVMKIGKVLCDLQKIRSAIQHADLMIRSLCSACMSLKFVVKCIKADLECRLGHNECFSTELSLQIQDKLETSEMVLKALEEELDKILSSPPTNRNVKTVWNHGCLKELENHIRGQILCWTSFLQILAHPTLLGQYEALQAHLPALREISDSVRSIVPSQMSVTSPVSRSNSNASHNAAELKYIQKDFDDLLFNSATLKRNYRTPGMTTLAMEKGFRLSRPNFSRPQPWQFSRVVGLPLLAEEQFVREGWSNTSAESVNIETIETEHYISTCSISNIQIQKETENLEDNSFGESATLVRSQDTGLQSSSSLSGAASTAILTKPVMDPTELSQTLGPYSIWRLFDQVKYSRRRKAAEPASAQGKGSTAADLKKVGEILQKVEPVLLPELLDAEGQSHHPGLCYIDLKIKVHQVQIHLEALFDPGLSSNILCKDFAKILNLIVTSTDQKWFTYPDGRQVKVSGLVTVPITVGHRLYVSPEFLIIEDRSQSLLLGSPMTAVVDAIDCTDLLPQDLTAFPRLVFTSEVKDVSFGALSKPPSVAAQQVEVPGDISFPVKIEVAASA